MEIFITVLTRWVLSQNLSDKKTTQRYKIHKVYNIHDLFK